MRVELSEQHFTAIGHYIEGHFNEWLYKYLPFQKQAEDFTKTQTEILDKISKSDERFDAFLKRAEKYDEKFDKLNERSIRIEEETKQLRYETNELRQDMKDLRQEMKDLRQDMKEEFAAANSRFENLQTQMNSRFDAQTKRMDSFMIWSFGTMLTIAGISTGIILNFN